MDVPINNGDTSADDNVYCCLRKAKEKRFIEPHDPDERNDPRMHANADRFPRILPKSLLKLFKVMSEETMLTVGTVRYDKINADIEKGNAKNRKVTLHPPKPRITLIRGEPTKTHKAIPA
jgi:hypothetical protein